MTTNNIIAFVVGVVVGALGALLFAPKSGQDLRADLAHEAQVERDRLMKEYHQAVGQVQEGLNKVHADVQATLDQVKEKAQSTTNGTEVETAA